MKTEYADTYELVLTENYAEMCRNLRFSVDLHWCLRVITWLSPESHVTCYVHSTSTLKKKKKEKKHCWLLHICVF